jgi:hypothetical protein
MKLIQTRGGEVCARFSVLLFRRSEEKSAIFFKDSILKPFFVSVFALKFSAICNRAIVY